eukprot:8389562-Karenia_brevis.AAC.1
MEVPQAGPTFIPGWLRCCQLVFVSDDTKVNQWHGHHARQTCDKDISNYPKEHSVECRRKRSMARDFGAQFGLPPWTDSTTARGASSKRGVQSMRHLDTAFLWIQSKVLERKITLMKISTHDNVADLFTKHLGGVPMQKHILAMGLSHRSG